MLCMSPGRQVVCKPKKSQERDQLLPSDLATELTNGVTLQYVPGVKMNSWGSLKLKFIWRGSELRHRSRYFSRPLKA